MDRKLAGLRLIDTGPVYARPARFPGAKCGMPQAHRRRHTLRQYLLASPTRLPVLLLAFCAVYGTAGYVVIEGYSLLDGLYMTVTTLTTVGFGEIEPLGAGGRLFTLTLLGIGFTAVFTILGAGATLLGSALLRNQDTVVRWFGVLIIVLGLSTMGLLRVPLLHREKRLDLARVPRGPAWAFPMGMAFAAGWAPCIGPILATILATASVAGSWWWGAILLALYSAGLGIPFVLLALGFTRAQGSLAWLRRHGRQIEVLGGTLLVAVGTLFVTGRWLPLFRPMQRWFAQLGWPPI